MQPRLAEESMRLAAVAVLFYAITAHAAPPATERYLHAGALGGTMLRPKTSGAAVLIIPGSGPTDRDGNNRLGVRGSPYKMLAEGLAQRGVTTVRADKRGMFGSSGAAADANAVTISDYAGDVRAWVKTIRQETGAPCVWVAGHSEGGLVALASSARPEGFCGLILLAAPGRPVGDVLRDQLQLALGNGPMLQQATTAIKALEAGRHPDMYSMHPALQQLFAPPIQGLLISMFSYDPARLIAGFHKPVLIVQGERDIQVSVGDAERLKQAAPWAKLILLPDTDHTLRAVKSADTPARMTGFGRPGIPLAPRVADEISDFVLAADSSRGGVLQR
jgi:pimeloyl-ACP methyl ester carboxylesterase